MERYRTKAAAERAQPEKWVFTRTDGSGLTLWDSEIRQALKQVAAAEGCDFLGANITWWQEEGGSAIEAKNARPHLLKVPSSGPRLSPHCEVGAHPVSYFILMSC